MIVVYVCSYISIVQCSSFLQIDSAPQVSTPRTPLTAPHAFVWLGGLPLTIRNTRDEVVGVAKLRLPQESQEVFESLHVRGVQPHVLPITRSNITKHRDFAVVHIASHGMYHKTDPGYAEGLLCLPDVKDDSTQVGDVLGPGEASALFPACESRPALLVLLCCHSMVFGRPVFRGGGATFVLGIKEDFEVLDKACILFAKVFYPALAQGSTVPGAFQVALEAVRTQFGDPEAGKFELLGPCASGPAPPAPLLCAATQTAASVASRPLVVSNEKCVWRDVEQDEVVLRLNHADTRVLEVVGGK